MNFYILPAINTFTTEDKIMDFLINTRLDISSQLGTENFNDQPIGSPLILIAEHFPELKNYQVKAYLFRLEEQEYLQLNTARSSIASLSITFKGQAYFSTRAEKLRIEDRLERRRLFINIFAATIGSIVTLIANWLYAYK